MTSTVKTDTLRSSDTVHVPVRLILSFQKRKQDKPLQFIKEIELLRQTEHRKELSTSTFTSEDSQEKMNKHKYKHTMSILTSFCICYDAGGHGLWGMA